MIYRWVTETFVKRQKEAEFSHSNFSFTSYEPFRCNQMLLLLECDYRQRHKLRKIQKVEIFFETDHDQCFNFPQRQFLKLILT